MPSCIHRIVRRSFAATLIFALLFAAAYASDYILYGSAAASPAFVASANSADIITLQPRQIDYPVIDQGLDSHAQTTTLNSSTSSSSIQEDSYPGPSMRGYPAPKPFHRFTINPKLRTTIQAFLREFSAELTFDVGTTDETVEVQLFALEGQNRSIAERVLGMAFSMQVFNQQGNAIVQFNKPVQVVFTMGVAGSSGTTMMEQDLKLFQWDTSSAGWVPILTEINSADGTLTTSITRPGELAIMQNDYIFIPTVYGPRNSSQVR